jgi:hypothetical protein
MPRYTLETIVVVSFVLWLLGAVIYPVGGVLIHLLLFVALAVVVFRFAQGRRALN